MRGAVADGVERVGVGRCVAGAHGVGVTGTGRSATDRDPRCSVVAGDLQIAQLRVERDALLGQEGQRVLHRRDDVGVALVEVAWGRHRLGCVEGHLPALGRCAQPELAEHVRPDAVDVVAPVPTREDLAPGAATRGRAHVLQVVALAGELTCEHAVLVLYRLELGVGEGVRSAHLVGAGEAVHDVAVDHPAADGALALLAADDPGEALEPLRRVGQPIAVVGVDDPVTTDRVRQVRRPEDARPGGIDVVAPGAVAVGAGAVQCGQAGQLEKHPADRGRTGLDEVVRDVGDHGVVGVKGVALAVGRHRVDPGDARRTVLRRGKLLDGAGRGHLMEGVEGLELLAVGVAQREEAHRRPAHEQVRGVQDETFVGPVEVLDHLADRAVLVLHRDADLVALQLLRSGGRQIGRGSARQGAVLIRREAVGRRHGVRPGDVVVPPDVDHGGAVEHRAGDVVDARDRQLGLGEAVAAAPREVRVAEQHALAGGCRVATEGGAVGAERAGRVLAQPGLESLGGRQDRRYGGEARRHRERTDRQAEVVRRRRGRVRDLRNEHACRGQQVGRVDAVVEIERLGWPYPVGALAGRVLDAVRTADVRQVAVDALDVALDQRADLVAGTAQRVVEQRLDDLAVAQVGEQHVGLQVGREQGHLIAVTGVRTEEAGALTTASDEGVGERADRVLGHREASPEAQRHEVLGDNVRDAVLGPGDRGLRDTSGRLQQVGRLRRRRRCRAHQGGQRREAAGEQERGRARKGHARVLRRAPGQFLPIVVARCRHR